MANKLTEALERNRRAADELDRALRDCLSAIKDKPETVVEGRFRVIAGGAGRERIAPSPPRCDRMPIGGGGQTG